MTDPPHPEPDDGESYSYRETLWGRVRSGVRRLLGQREDGDG